jgi:hypothetical protein
MRLQLPRLGFLAALQLSQLTALPAAAAVYLLCADNYSSVAAGLSITRTPPRAWGLAASEDEQGTLQRHHQVRGVLHHPKMEDWVHCSDTVCCVMCCAGPWAPLKFLFEADLAPYGVLAMTVFGCMFATLTEWPAQVTQVRETLWLLGVQTLCKHGGHVCRQLCRLAEWGVHPATTWQHVRKSARAGAALVARCGDRGHMESLLNQLLREVAMVNVGAMALHGACFVCSSCGVGVLSCRRLTTLLSCKWESPTWPWALQVRASVLHTWLSCTHTHTHSEGTSRSGLFCCLVGFTALL